MERVVAAVVVLVVVFGAGLLTGLRLSATDEDPGVDPDAAAIAPGSLADPLPRGQPAEVGAWLLTVVDVDTDAADRVMAANQFNSAPPQAHNFVLVEVSLERRGSGPAVVRGTIVPRLGTPAGRLYPLTQGCGVLSDPLDAGQPVGEGQTITGQWCWVVPTPDIPKLRLQVAGTGGGAVWFRLS